MTSHSKMRFEFGTFTFDGSERLLFEAGQPLSLTPKAIAILQLLLENAGRLVEKDQLLELVWPNTVVEEATVAQNVFTLRKILRDGIDGARYIETVPKRGYRFVAAVKVTEAHIAKALESVPAFSRRVGDRAMLVVLPLDNLTGSPELDYLCDGFTEAIIAELGALNPKQLGVIARTSSMTYKATRKTVRDIAIELNVQSVLEGSLRRTDDRFVVTLQLISAEDQTHLWTKNYAHTMQDVLQVQAEVARGVADEMQIQLLPKKREQLHMIGQVTPEAYELYLRGRFHWNKRSADELRLAIDCYERALVIDPAFAPAHAGIATCWMLYSVYGAHPPQETFPKAKAAATTAISLDDGLSEAHAALAFTLAWFDHNWEQAESEFMRAIALDPNSPFAHHWFALFLGMVNRADEGLQQALNALQLDPLSPVIRMNYGFMLDLLGHNFTAVEVHQQVLAMSPQYYFGRLMLAGNYSKLGLHGEAIKHFELAYEHSNRQPEMLAHLAYGCGFAGLHTRAQSILADLLQSGARVSPYYLARVFASLGDIDRGIEQLTVALDEKSIPVIGFTLDYFLKPLSGDERFLALIKRLAI